MVEKKASGSRDQPKYGNPESEHGPKGKPGRPSNTQPTNQVPPVKQRTNLNTPNMEAPNIKEKQEHPKHDADWDHSKSKAHWDKKPKQYVVDQL